jgi:hypothetical protein
MRVWSLPRRKSGLPSAKAARLQGSQATILPAQTRKPRPSNSFLADLTATKLLSAKTWLRNAHPLASSSGGSGHHALPLPKSLSPACMVAGPRHVGVGVGVLDVCSKRVDERMIQHEGDTTTPPQEGSTRRREHVSGGRCRGRVTGRRGDAVNRLISLAFRRCSHTHLLYCTVLYCILSVISRTVTGRLVVELYRNATQDYGCGKRARAGETLRRRRSLFNF